MMKTNMMEIKKISKIIIFMYNKLKKIHKKDNIMKIYK